MLQMPRVPAVKPAFSFGDVAFYQAKQDVGKEIVECLRWMQAHTVIPGYQEMLGRFIASVPCTTNIRDLARLPHQANLPADVRGTSKLGCVYTRLSWVVQIYWTMCIDGIDHSDMIREHLAWVRAVWSYGVEKCKMIGSPREGYTLEIPV